MGKFRSNHDSWRPGGGGGGDSGRDRGRGRSTSRDRHRSPPPFPSRKRKAGIPPADTWTPGSPARDYDKSSYQPSYPRERKRSRDMSIDSRNGRRYSSISPKRPQRDDRNYSPLEDFDDARSRPSDQRRRPPRSPKRRRSPSPHYPGHKSSKKSRRGRSPRLPRRSSLEPPPQSRRRDDSRGRSPRRNSPALPARGANWESQKDRRKSRSASPSRNSPPRRRSVSPASSPNNRGYQSSRFPSPPRQKDRDIKRSSPPSDRRMSPSRRRKFSPPLPPRSRRDRRNKKRKGSPRRRSPPSSRPQSRSPARRQPSPQPNITDANSPTRRISRSPRSRSPKLLPENQDTLQRASVEAPPSKEIDMLKEFDDDLKTDSKPNDRPAPPRKSYSDDRSFRPRSPIPSGPRAHNMEPRINRGNYKGRNFDPDYAAKRKRSPRGKRARNDFHQDDDRSNGQSYRPPFTGANAIPTGPAQDSGHSSKHRSDNQYSQSSNRHRDSSPGRRADRREDYKKFDEDDNTDSHNQDTDRKSRRNSYDNDEASNSSQKVHTSTVAEAESTDQVNHGQDSREGSITHDTNDKNGSNSMPPPSLADAPSSKTLLEAPSKPVGGDEPKGKIRFSLSKSGKPPVATATKFDTPGRGRFATSANQTPVGPRKSQNMEPPPTTEQTQKTTSVVDDQSALASAMPTAVVKRNSVKILQRTTSIYDRISMVGEGTYGKVYKAQNAASKELVALKRIRLEQERDGFPVTALRELKILQSLQHKNVIRLLETMVEKNEFYMIFEYMDHDLTGILNHPTFKLDLSNIKDLAKQFVEGLEYLHHRSVLHRDIKGSNILLDNNGQLKLADFGLARTYQKRRKDLDYTNRIITLWYRPPEILLGATVYGAAVDMWSAGCVLVELFTSKAIFPGRTEIDQLDCIYNVLGTPDQQVWPELKSMPWYELIKPKELKASTFNEKYKDALPSDALDLVQKLFQYDPKKRPTASEVLEHSYFKNEPTPQPCLAIRDVKGDWHEYESKGRRKKEQKQQHEQQQKLAQEQKRQQ